MTAKIENNVNKLRLGAGMTQEELAQRAGVTRQTVISIEKGSYTPSVLLALKVAKVFKKPIEEIFYIKND